MGKLLTTILAGITALSIGGCNPKTSTPTNYQCVPIKFQDDGQASMAVYQDGKRAGFRVKKEDGTVQYWISKELDSPSCWAVDSEGVAIPGRNSKDVNNHLDKIQNVYKQIKNCEKLLEK